jgi:hypothetical protein
MNVRVMMLVVLFAAACSPLTPRRMTLAGDEWLPQTQAPIVELPDTDENLNPKRASAAARSIATSSWEHYNSFDIGILEFTEWGGLWSEAQRKMVIEKVREIAEEQGATVIVYAHGWHHSARWNDTNLVSFRHVLRFLAARGRGGMRCKIDVNAKSTRVIGIYIGWRGESVPVPIANLATIWSRKRVAQAIGGPSTNWEARKVRQRKPQLATLLQDLDKIRDDANRKAVNRRRPFTSLTITGHSLGGAMLLSAMQQIVFEKTIDDGRPIDATALHRIGDAVILINPAVEARRYRTFRAESSKEEFDAKQRPILLVLSSDGDRPNKIALKVARLGVTLLTPGRWREWHDSTTALGFSLLDITHRLAAGPTGAGILSGWDQCRRERGSAHRSRRVQALWSAVGARQPERIEGVQPVHGDPYGQSGDSESQRHLLVRSHVVPHPVRQRVAQKRHAAVLSRACAGADARR